MKLQKLPVKELTKCLEQSVDHQQIITYANFRTFGNALQYTKAFGFFRNFSAFCGVNQRKLYSELVFNFGHGQPLQCPD